MIKHLSYDEALTQARERMGNRELSDAAALTLTAAWYAPNLPAMVAVATQVWSPDSLVTDEGSDTIASRGEQFRDDLYRSLGNAVHHDDSEEMLVWSMLGTWSMNGGDNDET
jgi:hypothetical protein